MYIYVSKDRPARIFLIKERNEEHSQVMKSLGVKAFDRYFITDIDIEALKLNKVVVIEV